MVTFLGRKDAGRVRIPSAPPFVHLSPRRHPLSLAFLSLGRFTAGFSSVQLKNSPVFCRNPIFYKNRWFNRIFPGSLAGRSFTWTEPADPPVSSSTGRSGPNNWAERPDGRFHRARCCVARRCGSRLHHARCCATAGRPAPTPTWPGGTTSAAAWPGGVLPDWLSSAGGFAVWFMTLFVKITTIIYYGNDY